MNVIPEKLPLLGQEQGTRNCLAHGSAVGCTRKDCFTFSRRRNGDAFCPPQIANLCQRKQVSKIVNCLSLRGRKAEAISTLPVIPSEVEESIKTNPPLADSTRHKTYELNLAVFSQIAIITLAPHEIASLRHLVLGNS